MQSNECPDGSTGVWVYAVARDTTASRPGTLTGVTGVGGEAVRAIGDGEFTALASPVSLDDFGEEPLRRHMEHLPWLEAVARVHHAVIEAAARRVGALVPMRLATVYRSESGVVAMLSSHAADFLAALEHISGRVEWGVKAYPAQAAAASEPAVPVQDRPASGADYLRLRRAQLTASEDARRTALYLAERVHVELSELAEDSDLRTPQDPQLSGSPATMILNGSYLIDEARTESFVAAVYEAAGRYPAIRLELTGPWPPYSFASIGMQQVAL